MNGKIIVLISIIIAAALVAAWASPGGSEASDFKPEQPSITFSDTTVGGNPDITSNFNVNPPSANFSGQAGGAVTFTDSAVVIANDAAVPNGAVMGALTSTAKLGLANSGCFNDTPVTFTMIDATTSSSVIIKPSGPSSNLLANLVEDDGDLDNNGTVEQPAFANNGIPDGADAYPSFVRDSLDPDGPGGPTPPITPRARYFGSAFVANSLIVTLQFVIMDPGALSVMPDLGWMDAAWGSANMTFLNDPLAPPSNSAISDFCNFTSNTVLRGISRDNGCTAASIPGTPPCTQTGAGFTLRGASDAGCPGSTTPNECGSTRATNPGAAQTVTWRQWALSFRDWDETASPPQAGDGVETNIEACPLKGAGAGAGSGTIDSMDPRGPAPVEDTDFDGIANTSSTDPSGFGCDPTGVNTGASDHDTDGWLNRLDNCVFVKNGNMNTTLTAAVAQGATVLPVNATTDATINPLGFQIDDIVGLASGGTSETGLVVTAVNPGVSITVAAPGVALAGGFPNGATVRQDSHADNTGQNDGDIPIGTSVPDAGPRADALGAPCDPNPNAPNGHYHATVVATHVCIGAATSDCSGAVDTDGDGVFNIDDNCIGGANAAPAGFAQSQRDLNADGFSDISDIVLEAGAFGFEGGNPTAPAGYEGRLDLNFDRFTDISDIVLLAGTFGATC